jgi:transmembrane sensor
MNNSMARKNITKDLLSDLIIGNVDLKMDAEILNTEEVRTLFDHQWENPYEAESAEKPDFKKIFDAIKVQTNAESRTDTNSIQLLSHKLDDLNSRYLILRRRFRTAFAVAASVVLLIGFSIVYLINTNQYFRKTYTENIAPQGQKSSVILPDGTKAYLNSGSALRYDNFFGRKYRHVQLVGEAYFEVARNEKVPFIINTDVVQIKVLGTKFNVMAYPEDNIVETIVKEGEVSVSEINGQSALLLLANQKATFNKNTRKLVLGNADPEQYITWKENLLTFDNENFSNVIEKLERWYNVKIMVEGTDSIKDRFTLTIRSESLREVLELISLTTNIEYTINGNQVTIKYK